MTKTYLFQIYSPDGKIDHPLLKTRRALSTIYTRLSYPPYKDFLPPRRNQTEFLLGINIKFKESTLDYINYTKCYKHEVVKIENNATFIPLIWPMDIVQFLLTVDDLAIVLGTEKENISAIEKVKNMNLNPFNKLKVIQLILDFTLEDNNFFRSRVARNHYIVNSFNPKSKNVSHTQKMEIVRSLKNSLIYYVRQKSDIRKASIASAMDIINQIDLEKESVRIQDMYYILLGTLS